MRFFLIAILGISAFAACSADGLKDPAPVAPVQNQFVPESASADNQFEPEPAASNDSPLRVISVIDDEDDDLVDEDDTVVLEVADDEDVARMLGDMLDDVYVSDDFEEESDREGRADDVEVEAEQKDSVNNPVVITKYNQFIDAFLRRLSVELKGSADPMEIQIMKAGKNVIAAGQKGGAKRKGAGAKRKGAAGKRKGVAGKRKGAGAKRKGAGPKRKGALAKRRAAAAKRRAAQKNKTKRRPNKSGVKRANQKQNNKRKVTRNKQKRRPQGKEGEVEVEESREPKELDLDDEVEEDEEEDEEMFLEEGELIRSKRDVGDEFTDEELRELETLDNVMEIEDDDEDSDLATRDGRAIQTASDDDDKKPGKVVDEFEGRQRKRRRQKKKKPCKNRKCRNLRRRNNLRRRRRVQAARRRRLQKQRLQRQNRSKRSAGSPATISGLSKIRRSGNVRVSTNKGHQTLTADVQIGPVHLKAQKNVKTKSSTVNTLEALATAPNVKGKLTIIVNKDGRAFVKMFRVERPKVIRVTGDLNRSPSKSSDKYMQGALKASNKIIAFRMFSTAKQVLRKSSLSGKPTSAGNRFKAGMRAPVSKAEGTKRAG